MFVPLKNNRRRVLSVSVVSYTDVFVSPLTFETFETPSTSHPKSRQGSLGPPP